MSSLVFDKKTIASSWVPFTAGTALTILIFALLYAGGYFIPSWAVANTVNPLFSPGSEDDIISLVSSAQSTIDLEMYTFSNMNLADAIVAQARQGVKCRVILELRLDNPSSVIKMADYLTSHGVEVRFASKKFTLTHSKQMIIDGRRALVGSINFSNNAVSKNREAAVILSGPVVSQYQDIFNSDWEDASPSSVNN